MGNKFLKIKNRNVFKAKLKPEYATSSNENFVALKQINQKEEKEGFPITALREVKLLSKLKHKNIIDLIEIVTSKRIFRHFIKENSS